MEKISGIIPSSARLASVDLKEAAPIRPGTPSFGRPEGVSSLKGDVISFDTSRKSNGVHQEMVDWRSRDTRQAALVSDLSDKFFGKRATTAGEVVDRDASNLEPLVSATRSNPAGFKTDDFFIARTGKSFASEPAMIQQPEGMFPKGSFLDRKV